MQPQAIGFVGVGMMGWPMARCLHAAGHALVVCDATPGLAERFAAEIGGRAAASPAEVARQCGVVILMLPDSRIVSRVLFDGPDPLSAGLAPGASVIDMTSGVPEMTIGFGARLAEAGVRMIDAPVSGGVRRAETGKLTIMAGGAAEDVARLRPVLEAMGAVEQIGDLGAGQAMKSLNNLVSAAGFLVGIEALLIGRKFGLDPERMVDVLNGSTGMNNSTLNKFKQFVLSGRYDAGFGLGLMAKDLRIALGLAASTGTPAPLSAQCAELWAAAAATLGEGADHTEIARMSESFARVRLSEGAEQEPPADG